MSHAAGAAGRTDSSISDRVTFMRIDDRDKAALHAIKKLVDRELTAALDKFYEQVRATPQTRAFFQDESHMEQAKGAQLRHWDAVSAGNFDGVYVENVRRVGETHARIGLEPRWYIGGYALIIEHIIHAVLDSSASRGSFFGAGNRNRQLAASLSALIKSAMLDMDLSISVYIEAAENAKRELEAAKEVEQSRLTTLIGDGLSKLAAKDLTYRLMEELPEGYGQLKTDFNRAIGQLEVALKDVDSATEAIFSGSEEISKASHSLARRTEEQAAKLEETAAAVNEVTASIQSTAKGAGKALEVAGNATNEANVGSETVGRAIDAMGQIEKSSKDISQIINVIDEIAFQTNLLALNAGVEAARAGEAGRGFAVVASEVRALAQRSADAAKEIADLISSSERAVSDGVDLVAQTGQSLERIAGTTAEINTIINDIATGAREQADAMEQVNSTVHMLDHVTQENAAMSEQSTAASEALKQQGGQLSNLIGSFEIGRQGNDRVRRELQAVAPHAFGQPQAQGQIPTFNQADESSRGAHLSSVSPAKRAAAGGDDGWEEF